MSEERDARAASGRHVAVYFSGINAETFDRAAEPSADEQGHVVTGSILRRSEPDPSLVPVRVRIAHGVAPATASSMLRKIADLIDRAPDYLSAPPGSAIRRMPDGSAVRKRLTPEGLLRAADEMDASERRRLIDMMDEIRMQITDDPPPEDDPG